MSNDLKKELIRLGSTNPDLQKHLRPVIAEIEKTAVQIPVFPFDSNYLEKMMRDVEDDLRNLSMSKSEASDHIQNEIGAELGSAVHLGDIRDKNTFLESESKILNWAAALLKWNAPEILNYTRYNASIRDLLQS